MIFVINFNIFKYIYIYNIYNREIALDNYDNKFNQVNDQTTVQFS